jgi:hypothetical protein
LAFLFFGGGTNLFQFQRACWAHDTYRPRPLIYGPQTRENITKTGSQK